jgi:hypothetical protein
MDVKSPKEKRPKLRHPTQEARVMTVMGVRREASEAQKPPIPESELFRLGMITVTHGAFV